MLDMLNILNISRPLFWLGDRAGREWWSEECVAVLQGVSYPIKVPYKMCEFNKNLIERL